MIWDDSLPRKIMPSHEPDSVDALMYAFEAAKMSEPRLWYDLEMIEKSPGEWSVG